MAGPNDFWIDRVKWPVVAMLLAACGCVLVAGPAGLVAAGPSGAASAAYVIAILAWVAAGALVLAVLAVVSWRHAAMLSAESGLGEVLADWSFPADEWDAALVRRQGSVKPWQWLKALLIAGLALLLPAFAALGLDSQRLRIMALSALALGAVVLCLLVKRLFEAVAQRRAARMRMSPRVLIGCDGMQCGYEHTRWNRGGRVLKYARVAKDDPGLLEVVTGPGPVSRVANGVLLALSVVALFADGALIYGSGTQIITTLIPIPAARQGEAATLVRALLERQPGAVPAQGAFATATPA